LNEPDQPSDQTLAQRSRAGDRSAFEQLVRRTGRLVFSRLYLETGNAHEAEDLTQETFLVAWRKIHHLDDPASFRGWVLAIAVSVHLDAIKARNRKKRGQPGSTGMEIVPDASPTPPEHLEQTEQRQQVLAALRSLPADYQQPLSLRYLAGSDYDTISRQLGLTNGSLRGLLHRGLEMLRDRMK
jgi:RNA polymerase sigma-70 factor (ECF subfamily)